MGKFKVIKMREFTMVECHVPFNIMSEVNCDENYEFPEDALLFNAETKYLKNLRGIFKSKAKTEIMKIAFNEEMANFSGEVNTKMGYEVKKQLIRFGKYLSPEPMV